MNSTVNLCTHRHTVTWINLDAALREELLDVKLGQAIPQVAAPSDSDDLTREPISSGSEGRSRLQVDHQPSLTHLPAPANATVPAKSFILPSTLRFASQAMVCRLSRVFRMPRLTAPPRIIA